MATLYDLLVGKNPAQLLYLLGGLLGQACGWRSAVELLVRSLTLDDGDPPSIEVFWTASVNSLPPLALDQTISPCCTKKGLKVKAKLLNSLGDLEYTVDEIFVLDYPVDFLALAAPPWEETLINLDYLLAWFCPLLKTIRNAQSGDATSMSRKSNKSEMLGLLPSQSGGGTEIALESSSTPGHAQQNFSPSQPDEPLEVILPFALFLSNPAVASKTYIIRSYYILSFSLNFTGFKPAPTFTQSKSSETTTKASKCPLV
ncbi:hypothetical protein DSO57_1031401 [Entomophthora muscae]|uniref:Uncharacterized protein n=1 Tax=Entomophthora muscae TaxID=34485 RepID=A0ACC2UMN6_9FUNG|nr:hypothetical protein DSO57_1031401 [Entomophthora muscae]